MSLLVSDYVMMIDIGNNVWLHFVPLSFHAVPNAILEFTFKYFALVPIILSLTMARLDIKLMIKYYLVLNDKVKYQAAKER
jgi:hypothetical protein